MLRKGPGLASFGRPGCQAAGRAGPRAPASSVRRPRGSFHVQCMEGGSSFAHLAPGGVGATLAVTLERSRLTST